MNEYENFVNKIKQELKKQNTDQLLQRLERTFCVECDYAGPCTCSLSREELKERGIYV